MANRLINLSFPDSPELFISICDTFLARFKGLMLTPSIDPLGGILIDEKIDSRVNTSIHMFFMRYDIAVIWIDSNWSVVDTAIARRWRPYYAPKAAARYILETHPERINDYHPGDRLKLANA